MRPSGGREALPDDKPCDAEADHITPGPDGERVSAPHNTGEAPDTLAAYAAVAEEHREAMAALAVASVGGDHPQGQVATILQNLRVPDALAMQIDRELARRGHTDWTAGIFEFLTEAIRMSCAPGIVYVDGRGGRRAMIAHVGLNVWEIVATWREGGESWDTLRTAYPDLRESELRTALSYYQFYPGEIDARLSFEAAWSPGRVTEMPFTRPSHEREPGD